MKTEVSFPEIPREEYQGRVSKAKQEMKARGLDALLLFSKENLTYFTGFRKTWYFPWLHGAIILKEGEPILIVPQICHVLAMHMTWLEDENIIPYGGADYWGLPQVPTEVFSKKLQQLGLEKANIGTEEGGPGFVYMEISFSEFEKIKKSPLKYLNTTGVF